MACLQTLSGIKSLDCPSSMGGIKKVWIATYKEGAYTAEEGVVTSIDSGVTWYEYEFKKNTGSMTSTLNSDPANGVSYVSTEIVLQFTKMETAKRIEMAALAIADTMMIVEDSNGERWALGMSEPVIATAGSGQSGTAKGDGNFYQITMTDEHTTFPFALDESVTLKTA